MMILLHVFLSEGVPSEASEQEKAGSPKLELEEKTDVQLEPSQEEMERERLTSKAEQVCKRKRSIFHSLSPLSLPLSLPPLNFHGYFILSASR